MRRVHGRHWRRRRRIEGPCWSSRLLPLRPSVGRTALPSSCACSRRAAGWAGGRRSSAAPAGSFSLLQFAVGMALAGARRVDDRLSDRALALARQRFAVLAVARLIPRSARPSKARCSRRCRRRAPAARHRDRRRVALVESVEAIVDVFGALLLFVADRRCVAPTRRPTAANPMLRFVRRLVPTTDDFRGQRSRLACDRRRAAGGRHRRSLVADRSTRRARPRKRRDARLDALGSCGLPDPPGGGRSRTRPRLGGSPIRAGALAHQTEWAHSRTPISSSDCRSSAGSR